MANTVYGTGYADGINNGWMKGLIDSKVPDKNIILQTFLLEKVVKVDL